MVAKKRKSTRQAGSEKVWLDEESGLFWVSALVNDGRVTRQFNGPRAATLEDAHEGLNEALRM